MTREESALILMELGTNYPDTDKGKSREAMSAKINLWASMFAEEPFSLVQAAVRAYIANSTERFAPNIGQVKEEIRKLTHPDELTEGEAWELVRNAIRNSGYNAAEEFSKLPPLLQKVVGSPQQLREWGLMPSDTVQSVIAALFQRNYRAVQAREAAMEKTPPQIRQLFESLTKPVLTASSAAPAIEAPPTSSVAPSVTSEAMQQKIAELRIAAGEVVITEESKQAAIAKLLAAIQEGVNS